MNNNEIYISEELYNYSLSISLRENDILKQLRIESLKEPSSNMLLLPEQGQFLAFLVKLIGAKKTIDIGTYTGYSALCVAQAMDNDSITIACDSNKKWTDIAKKFWTKANVAHKIDLRLGQATDTLKDLINNGGAGTFDFIFIDADKQSYNDYYEKSLQLIHKGGLIAIDNILLSGTVIKKNIKDKKANNRISSVTITAIRKFNEKVKQDKRVDISYLPFADGFFLIRKI